MTEEYWYVFSTARNMKTGKFELQCFLEIPPEKNCKVSDFLICSKDEIYINCYKMNNKDISHLFNLDDIAQQIWGIKLSANANNAIPCFIKTECSIDRDTLDCLLSSYSYEKIMEFRM